METQSYIEGVYDTVEAIEKAISSSDNPLAKLDAVVKVIRELKGE